MWGNKAENRVYIFNNVYPGLNVFFLHVYLHHHHHHYQSFPVVFPAISGRFEFYESVGGVC